MIVLGIDPGTAALGFGIVEAKSGRLRMVDAGTLMTKPDASLPKRLLAIHGLLDELIALHRPDLLAVERLFFSRNAQTAFAVGQARGVVLLAAAQAEVPVREATPNEVKVAVTGYGGADKEQVGRMVAVCLGLAAPAKQDDTNDALAIAIWAANAERAGTGNQRSAVLDRASVNPMAAGENSYERAVREALATEKSHVRGKAPARSKP
jgi:crossover junction endodeoxyribonuclease RuvC